MGSWIMNPTYQLKTKVIESVTTEPVFYSKVKLNKGQIG